MCMLTWHESPSLIQDPELAVRKGGERSLCTRQCLAIRYTDPSESPLEIVVFR